LTFESKAAVINNLNKIFNTYNSTNPTFGLSTFL
jgi:hypothetical protein